MGSWNLGGGKVVIFRDALLFFGSSFFQGNLLLGGKGRGGAGREGRGFVDLFELVHVDSEVDSKVL